MPHPRANSVPTEKKSTRRFSAVYIALTSTRAREIMGVIGRKEYLPQAGEENAWLQELALIVDEALQREVERRKG